MSCYQASNKISSSYKKTDIKLIQQQRHMAVINGSSSEGPDKSALVRSGNNATTNNNNDLQTIRLYPPQSLQDRKISIEEPKDDEEPPAWMRKYFSAFLERQKSSSAGAGQGDEFEETGAPLGVSGVYGYLFTVAITSVLVVAIIYEKFFTDTEQLTRAALKEKRIRDEMQRIEAEMRKDRLKAQVKLQHLANETLPSPDASTS